VRYVDRFTTCAGVVLLLLLPVQSCRCLRLFLCGCVPCLLPVRSCCCLGLLRGLPASEAVSAIKQSDSLHFCF
jgi:hypothetical protein